MTEPAEPVRWRAGMLTEDAERRLVRDLRLVESGELSITKMELGRRYGVSGTKVREVQDAHGIADSKPKAAPPDDAAVVEMLKRGDAYWLIEMRGVAIKRVKAIAAKHGLSRAPGSAGQMARERLELRGRGRGVAK